MTTIPLNNILYMLCYAWRRLEFDTGLPAAQEDLKHPENLLARLFSLECERLFRIGLYREYIPMVEEGRRIVGRIDFQQSLKRFLLPQGQVVCHYDELSYDNAPNRIIKAAARRLLDVAGLHPEHRPVLQRILHRLPEIADEPLRSHRIHEIRIHRQLQHYQFLLLLCELIAEHCLVSENGERHFRRFIKEKKNEFARLFEEFVFGFYQTMYQTEFSDDNVEKKQFPWQLMNDNESSVIPNLNTDILLTNKERKIIIECKFYNKIFVEHHGKRTIRSAHLNQLFAYLSNVPNKENKPLAGILLYGCTNEDQTFEPLMFRLANGADVKVAGLNLTQHWMNIEEQLRRLF